MQLWLGKLFDGVVATAYKKIFIGERRAWPGKGPELSTKEGVLPDFSTKVSKNLKSNVFVFFVTSGRGAWAP